MILVVRCSYSLYRASLYSSPPMLPQLELLHPSKISLATLPIGDNFVYSEQNYFVPTKLLTKSTLQHMTYSSFPSIKDSYAEVLITRGFWFWAWPLYPIKNSRSRSEKGEDSHFLVCFTYSDHLLFPLKNKRTRSPLHPCNLHELKEKHNNKKKGQLEDKSPKGQQKEKQHIS